MLVRCAQARCTAGPTGAWRSVKSVSTCGVTRWPWSCPTAATAGSGLLSTASCPPCTPAEVQKLAPTARVIFSSIVV